MGYSLGVKIRHVWKRTPNRTGRGGGRQVRKVHGVGDRMWQMFRPLAFKDAWSIIPMLLRPKSKGNVRLKSANPYDAPIFNAGYFSDHRDILVLVEAVKFALALK